MATKKCEKCRFCELRRDPDPYDWFCDDDIAIWCIAKSKTGRKVCGANRPYEVKLVTAPRWCPERR